MRLSKPVRIMGGLAMAAVIAGGGRHGGWDPLGFLFPFHHR